MFGADSKALSAKHYLDIWLHLFRQIFPKRQKSIFSVHLPAHLNYLWQIIFFFDFCYKLSKILGNYWWILYSDILWLDNLIQSDKPKRLNFLAHAICRWPCQTIHKNHWEVECCTVILILSSNKTIKTLTSCSITQIVTQKGV